MTIAAFKEERKLKNRELAELLGISPGYACDLVKGNKVMSVALAKKLEGLSGKPWHTFIPGSAESLPGGGAGGQSAAPESDAA